MALRTIDHVLIAANQVSSICACKIKPFTRLRELIEDKDIKKFVQKIEERMNIKIGYDTINITFTLDNIAQYIDKNYETSRI